MSVDWREGKLYPRVGYAYVLKPDALGPVANKEFAPVRVGDIVRILIISSAQAEQPDDEDVMVVRVDGRMICDQCGKAYRDHPDDPACPWPTFVLLCDGTHAKT